MQLAMPSTVLWMVVTINQLFYLPLWSLSDCQLYILLDSDNYRINSSLWIALVVKVFVAKMMHYI